MNDPKYKMVGSKSLIMREAKALLWHLPQVQEPYSINELYRKFLIIPHNLLHFEHRTL